MAKKENKESKEENNNSDSNEQKIPPEMEKKLKVIKVKLERFQKEIVLGCPYDYEFFEKSLDPIIEKSQGGNTTHCGKVPSKLPSDSKKQVDIVKLNKQLDSAVKNENYEAAAKLRDQIKKLQ